VFLKANLEQEKWEELGRISRRNYKSGLLTIDRQGFSDLEMIGVEVKPDPCFLRNSRFSILGSY